MDINDRKKIWDIELKMFDSFKKICEKYHLEYFLIGGSAIGAVRHKGFIPWDDDMDIGMLRKDFELLMQHRDEFPENYYIEYGLKSTESFHYFCRIRDRKSTGIIKEQFRNPGVHGIFIEIYPFDRVPQNKLVRRIQWELSIAFIETLNHRIYHIQLGKKAFILNAIYRNKSEYYIYQKWNKLCQKYNHNTKKIMVDTVSIPYYSASEVDYFYLEDVINTVNVPYENTEAKIAIGNDRCLKKTYGDYMKLPPENERGTHHDKMIFYDPNKPYTKYIGSKMLEKYFE